MRRLTAIVTACLIFALPVISGAQNWVWISHDPNTNSDMFFDSDSIERKANEATFVIKVDMPDHHLRVYSTLAVKREPKVWQEREGSEFNERHELLNSHTNTDLGKWFTIPLGTNLDKLYKIVWQ